MDNNKPIPVNQNVSDYTKDIVMSVLKDVFEGVERKRLKGWDVKRVTISAGTEQSYQFDRIAPLILLSNIDGYAIDCSLSQSFSLANSFVFTERRFIPVQNEGQYISFRNNTGSDCEIVYILAG